MIEIHSFKFDKALFDAAPAPQRAVYLMSSQLWNDVNILSRQMLICQTPADSECNHAEQNGRLAAQILNLRFLASRLHEGQSFYKRLKGVLPSWKEELSKEAVSAIASLNAYFAGNNSALSRLRKKIGFHTDYDLFEGCLQSLEDSHIEEFFGDTAANTLFMSGEAANLASLPWIAQTETRRDGLKKLIDHSLQAMAWTHAACHGYHQWFLNKYVFPHVSLQEEESLIKFTDIPAFKDLQFRFFADFNGMVPPETS